jgi:tetratricopeptide (TPR) repeat protein
MSGDAGQPRPEAGEIAPGAIPVSEASPPTASGPERDELSYPPVDFDAGFFESPPSASPESKEEWGPDPAVELSESPLAKRRRAQLKKYVSVGLGTASAVCLAALVKGTLATARGGSNPQGHASTAVEPAHRPLPEPVVGKTPSVAEAPVEKTPPAAEAPVENTPPAEETAAVKLASLPNGAGDRTTATAAKADNETPEPDPRDALRQKRASQAALERGRIAASIEAGENAVLLDPLDADAWLILGAAYQQKGDLGQARRCYKACVQRAQRGSRRECFAMVR